MLIISSFYKVNRLVKRENGFVWFWLCIPKEEKKKKKNRLERTYASSYFLSGSHRLTYIWRRGFVYM